MFASFVDKEIDANKYLIIFNAINILEGRVVQQVREKSKYLSQKSNITF